SCGTLVLHQPEVLPEIRARAEAAGLLILPLGAPDGVRHGDAAAVLRRQKGGVERDVADVAAAQLEAARDETEIHIGRERRGLREHFAPDALPQPRIGQRELHHVLEAPRERSEEHTSELQSLAYLV